MTPHAAGRLQAEALLEIARCREDQIGGHDAVFDDSLFVVDVVDETIQREDPLPQSTLDHLEFGPIDDAGHDVEGPDFFRARLVAIHGERDPHVEQR